MTAHSGTSGNDSETEIERTLFDPQIVRRSRPDDAASLFYRFYTETIVGGKWLCVVVKHGL
jgi:hypothetical protein